MSVKKIEVPEIGTVNFYKRRGARSIKLSIGPSGDLRVSMPAWVPYKTALGFVMAKKGWVLAQQAKRQNALQHGQAIGKAHHLVFVPAPGIAKATVKVRQNQIEVWHAPSQSSSDKDLQSLATKACLKAIKKEAEQLLPIRLKDLAAKYNFEFNEVSTRNLKSRWGSCNQQKNITLNIYLMQLPWHLIDYVILHELTHTKVMRHGPPFWAELEKHLPGARKLRKEISAFSPNFDTQS